MPGGISHYRVNISGIHRRSKSTVKTRYGGERSFLHSIRTEDGSLKEKFLGIYHLPEMFRWMDRCDKRIKGIEGCQSAAFCTDEFTQIEQAILNTYPKSDIQRCIIHKKRNILKKLRNKDKREAMDDFNEVLDIDNPGHTISKALTKLNQFIVKWEKIYPNMKNMFVRKKEYFSYLKYPFIMRRMVYTNNWIENLNKQIKRTTKIRGAFPTEKSAEKLITLKCMEKEDGYMKYPITSMLLVQDHLDDLLLSRYNKPGASDTQNLTVSKNQLQHKFSILKENFSMGVQLKIVMLFL